MGEITPKEFAQFIGKEMRLRCWRTATARNTPERKDHIMDKLVVPVEE